MNSRVIEVDGRRCHILQSDATPRAMVVKPLGPFEWKCLAEEFRLTEQLSGQPLAMAAFEMGTLDSFRQPDHDTLHWLTAHLLPRMKLWFGTIPVILGGYSLGGLFALWASTRTAEFEAVASCSPSLWAAWWEGYAPEHPSLARYAYLSVGDTEDHTHKMPYSLMGECLRRQHALNERLLGAERCTLEWNKGGHFADIEERKAKAFTWCIKRCIY